jgi:hypothetical protein
MLAQTITSCAVANNDGCRLLRKPRCSMTLLAGRRRRNRVVLENVDELMANQKTKRCAYFQRGGRTERRRLQGCHRQDD